MRRLGQRPDHCLGPHLVRARCSQWKGERRADTQTDRLLIKPVQRCLKYQLLLQSVIDYTDIDHPDYEQLQLAKTQMVAVADAINEVSASTCHSDVKLTAPRRPSDDKSWSSY